MPILENDHQPASADSYGNTKGDCLVKKTRHSEEIANKRHVSLHLAYRHRKNTLRLKAKHINDRNV